MVVTRWSDFSYGIYNARSARIMGMITDGFLECGNFEHWAEIPSSFTETKHFVYCPTCNKPMYLIRGNSPMASLHTENKKVTGIVKSHRR
jgi:hypothetical protein